MTCKNPDYQEFCSQSYKYAPVCEEINKENLNNPHETGSVLQVFELGKLLAERKLVKFRSEGICMYPCIRPRDTLYIEPRSIGEVKVGDIAVYRRYNRLFAHRTIAKGNDNGRDYIITRSDTAKFGNDGPGFNQDILGIVTRIERKERTFDTARKDYPLVEQLFLNVYLQYYRLKQHLWDKIIYFISWLQQYKAYRKLARLMEKSTKRIEFSLQVPINPRVNNRFSKEISAKEISESLKGESPISRWTIALNIDSKPAGFLSFFFKPINCPFNGWWLYEAKLRVRYRGTNLEERLLEEACSLLKESGAKGVLVSVFKNAHLDRKIFENMGFKEISVYKDIFLKNKKNEFIERSIMQKEL
ncbi:MAG: hypothetical protein ABSB18_06195 [Candidatus Omnitrophota bacterium]